MARGKECTVRDLSAFLYSRKASLFEFFIARAFLLVLRVVMRCDDTTSIEDDIRSGRRSLNIV